MPTQASTQPSQGQSGAWVQGMLPQEPTQNTVPTHGPRYFMDNNNPEMQIIMDITQHNTERMRVIDEEKADKKRAREERQLRFQRQHGDGAASEHSQGSP